jgi:ribonuclease PH
LRSEETIDEDGRTMPCMRDAAYIALFKAGDFCKFNNLDDLAMMTEARSSIEMAT